MYNKRSLLVAAMMSGLLGAGGISQPLADQPQTRIVQNVSKRQLMRRARGPMLYAEHRTSRRTVAQDKRQAQKRRNRLRHKVRA